jgi:hypothetical protein
LTLLFIYAFHSLAISLLVARLGERLRLELAECSIAKKEEGRASTDLNLGLTTVTTVGVHVCLAIGA